MGMPRELEMEPGRSRSESRTWLVREQQLESCIGRGTRHGGGGVALVRSIVVMRAVIGDSRYDDLRAFVLQHDVFVHEYAQSEPAKLGDPTAHPRVVLVISGDKVSPVTCRQPCQGLCVPRQLLDGAVYQVAGDGNHVRLEIVHRIDNRVDVAALDRRPDVDVADLRDGEAVEGRRQTGDRHVDGLHFGPPAGIDETHEGEQAREHRHGERAVGVYSLQRVCWEQPRTQGSG